MTCPRTTGVALFYFGTGNYSSIGLRKGMIRMLVYRHTSESVSSVKKAAKARNFERPWLLCRKPSSQLSDLVFVEKWFSWKRVLLFFKQWHSVGASRAGFLDYQGRGPPANLERQ